MYPTLPTLLRIAMVFSMGLEYFISGPRERPTVAIARKGDRKRFPERPDGAGTYEFECLDYPATERRMNAYYVEFERARSGGSGPHAHAGAEFIYLLKGGLALAVGDEEHVLQEGDSVYFDSGAPHAYRRVGAPACAAIVVTTP